MANLRSKLINSFFQIVIQLVICWWSMDWWSVVGGSVVGIFIDFIHYFKLIKFFYLSGEAVAKRCSVQIVFLEISQNS